VQDDQAALRHRQAELERHLFASPAITWADAAAKARYLIELFATTPEGRDPRRQQVIASALADLARLADPADALPPTDPPAANSR